MKEQQRPQHDEKTRRRIEAMVEAEARYLAKLRDAARAPGAPPPRIAGRRGFLAAAAAGASLLPKIVHAKTPPGAVRSEEHTSELQSRVDLVCRLLLEK